MKICYANSKVEKLLTSRKELSKFISNVSVINDLNILMTNLKTFKHLKDFYTIPVLKHYKLHDLYGDKNGIKSLCIKQGYRLTLTLILETINDNEDEIKILEVTKHYGD